MARLLAVAGGAKTLTTGDVAGQRTVIRGNAPEFQKWKPRSTLGATRGSENGTTTIFAVK